MPDCEAPDLRGVFIRGMDDFGTAAGSAGRDPEWATRRLLPNGGLASFQDDMFESHNHNFAAVHLWQCQILCVNNCTRFPLRFKDKLIQTGSIIMSIINDDAGPEISPLQWRRRYFRPGVREDGSRNRVSPGMIAWQRKNRFSPIQRELSRQK